MNRCRRTFKLPATSLLFLAFFGQSVVNGCAPTDNRGGQQDLDTPPVEKSFVDKSCQDVRALTSKAQPPASDAEFRERFLKMHNDIRRIYKLPDLTWDEGLAKKAKDWAENLRATQNCNLIHGSSGENLSWNSMTRYSPEAVVYGWAQECKDYNYNNLSCAPKKKCGHFTQVVWKKTARVGCGKADCKDGKSEVWVCRYDPVGNYIGKRPF